MQKKLIYLLSVVLLSLQLSVPVYSINVLPGNGKVSQPVTVDSESTGRQLVNGTNTTVDTSTPGKIKINASGGGGSSPFAPSGFAAVRTFQNWTGLAVSPDGQYVYVGGQLTSNTHAAIAKVKIADGTVAATCDLAVIDEATCLAVSPDGSAIYALNTDSGSGATTWWKVATSAMTITHTSTLAVGAVLPNANLQPFDLSPDGSIYAYVSGADAKLYMINTSTYAVTNATMNHTAGNLTAVCFYNGSNTNVYVAHAGDAHVDLYTTAGVYTSTVDTTAGGTPNFTAMRSGINGNFFIADNGTNKSVISVDSGTPQINLMHNDSRGIVVDTLSPLASRWGVDRCFISAAGDVTDIFELDTIESGSYALTPLPTPEGVLQAAPYGIAVTPDSATNIFTLSGANYPEVWSVTATRTVPPPNSAGNLQTSDGLGNWTSQTVSGDGTLSGAGALVVTKTNGTAFRTSATGNASGLNSGTVPAAQMPALTGDVTTYAGAVATTIKNDVALAGNPTTTTQSAGDNSTKIATTAYVDNSLPHSPSGYNGTGTLSSGTATITCAPCTTGSKIMVTDTGTSLTNVGALQIRTKNNGSFVVDSTNNLDASTFDWVLISP